MRTANVECRTAGARIFFFPLAHALRHGLMFGTGPPPDFLLNLPALANLMRLSSLKGAHVALFKGAWQEIRGPGLAQL